MKTKILILFAFCTFNLFSQTNVVPNGGFETWTNSTTLSDWATKNNVTQSTSSFIEGSKSAQLSIANSSTRPEIIAQVPMVAGKTYTVKFKYKYINTNYNGQHPISLNILKNGSATTLSSSTFATDNNWTVKETTFTPDQNMSYDLSISLFTFDAAAFNVLIDDVQVYIQGTEQYTQIPDVNFEKKLIALGIDSGATDGKVLTNSVNKLTSLDVSNSAIVDLTGIQDFVGLTSLKCYGNVLTALNVATNLSLNHLECDSNRLTALDVTANLALNYLECESNRITALNLSKNVSLGTLLCYDNQLTALDVVKNVALSSFNCSSNNLTSLNLKNGKNTLLTNSNINLSGNANLSCIVVDDVAYSNTNWATKKDAATFFSPADCSTVTKIPDAKFEDKLIALGIDTDGKNGVVLNSSISAITSLNVSNSSIADLIGIQGFTALTTLNCSGNLVKKIDLSKNTAMATLNCSSNPTLICIQVANVAAAGNWTTTKDATAIFSLDCTIYTLIPDAKFEDKLIALRIDKDGKNGKVATESIATVTSLELYGSSITDLTGIQDFKALTYLECGANQLKSLDVSKNVALTTLYCYNNQLTSLDVSKNVALKSLYCNSNQLTTLDISKNVALTSFGCDSNKLTNLNLKNGKNTFLKDITISNNPNLGCIVVDDVTYSNTNWSSRKDSFAFYSPFECSTITKIPDSKFEDKLIALNIDTDGKNGLVLNSSIAAITSLNVSNSTIADLTGIQGFTALTTLNCSGNLVKKIDLSKNTAIAALNCSNNPTLICIQVANVAAAGNWTTTKDATASFSLDCTIYTLIPDAKFEEKLIALGIDKDGKNGKVATESIASITSLEVYGSSFTDLTGIQDFKALTYLDCRSNQLKTLDVSKNIALTTLYFSSNQITTIDVSKNIALTYLNCYNNQLTTLDVSKNVALTYLSCYNNQLTTLDVSKNVALTSFDCSPNKLTSLNLKNGKNTLLTNSNIDLSSNPDLRCIVVDDVAYSNTNWATKKDAFAFFSPYDCATITKIPDTKFEDKLIALGIDTDGKNGVVLNASIAAITSLNVSNSTIADLTGIQGFTALTTLNCSGNLVKKIDLSKNTAMATLNCANNPTLTCIQVANVAATANWATTKDATASFSLDCTIFTLIPDAKFEEKLIAIGIDRDGKNGKVDTESIVSLTSLNVSSSSIADLTGIQDFKALTSLNCSSNQLKTLDVSKNLAFKSLTCNSNQLTSLNVSNNVALTSLSCDNNQLTSLDISKNVALTSLGCYENKLTTLDVSKNVALSYLSAYSNQLSTLDVSKNVALTSLYCGSNKLTSLNLKNGKNTLLTNNYLDLSSNLDLSCILVDDVTYSNTNWANRKDTFAFFSSYDCATVTKIADTKFEDKLIALGIDTDGKNGVVLNASIAAITSLNVSNSTIADLTGIQGFTALTTLNCSGNLVKKIDLSKNTAMATLNCSNNPTLTCIQVANVAAAANWATTKDAIASFSLDCTIYTLIPDAKFEDKLIALGIDRDGKNGKVDMESITSLTSLDVSGSSITDITGIQDFKALTTLYCYGNQITNLDLSKNTILKFLNCSQNKLATLDVSKNVSLTYLGCNDNQLNVLDVSKNVALSQFYCRNNNLQTLNLKNGKNNLLPSSNISLSGNSNLYCILVDDVTYSTTNWADRKDSHATFNSVECKALSLPANNFAVESKGETCTDSKNGEINIIATAAYIYKARINENWYPFTNNSLKVSNLAPGTYTVSITITGETFEQNFTVVIPKAATITGKSSVVANKVSIEITQGTAPYTVFVDGVAQFETTDNTFAVATKKGGLLEVKTAKACEGIYAATIAGVEGTVTAYPNPTSGSFAIQLATSRKEVVVGLYTLNGQLISTKIYTLENGTAQLSLENQPTGVYVAKIELDTPEYLKIIKN
jgi:Leucine-rich repeat (LRR) protein